MTDTPLTFGLIAFPNMTQLDLSGPFEVFARVPNATTHLLWKTLDPVKSDRGLSILPTATFGDCQALDVVCVPGGPGQLALMEDEEVIGFLKRIAPTCRYVTSVCTGSLVLGAAGLLKGYGATSHWASRNMLALLKATPIDQRVVFDGNRVTGGGVTSGIDFALALVAALVGEDTAKMIQLQLEYAPAPPFAAGTPAEAGPAITCKISEAIKDMQAKRREVAERIGKTLD